MSPRPLLALGPADGWHADQLRTAATKHGRDLQYADYETLTARIDHHGRHCVTSSAGELADFAAVLCRTMPMGSMEQILFRLATLHASIAAGVRIVNSPQTLELAIDKYATLAVVASLDLPVPETIIVQSRGEAMRAFASLGGDVVVKPIFGGEGRGVMRVRDEQLAWTTFSTLQQLSSVLYVQRFIPPGGHDTRLLVIGDEVFGVRRSATTGFRTNVANGGKCDAIELPPEQILLAKNIAARMELSIGSIDLLDNDDGPPLVVEVNGVPGWKGAQSCFAFNLAEKMIAAVLA